MPAQALWRIGDYKAGSRQDIHVLRKDFGIYFIQGVRRGMPDLRIIGRILKRGNAR